MASVTVVGAGAVGSYYGALLARAGHDVTLLARGAHQEALVRRGRVRVREPDGSGWSVRVRAAADPAGAPPDLVIVSVKAHATPRAARDAAEVAGPDTAVLSLQNGVENVARLVEALGPDRVVAGLAFVGLRVGPPGTVVRHGEGRVALGAPAGGVSPCAERVMTIVAAAWDVTLESDITRAQWEKLLWNVGFNTLCAVTGASADEALDTPESGALVRQAMEEVVAIARRRGVGIGRTEVEAMADPSPELAGYHPSMSYDLAAGRAPERDALSGFVVREGARLGVPTPVNRVLDALLALQHDRARRREGGGR